MSSASPKSASARPRPRFAALVEHTTDLIAVVDLAGTIQYMSPAVNRTLGHDQGDLDGRNVLELVHPDDAPSDLIGLAQPDDHGIGSPVVLRMQAADESWRYLEVIVTDLTENPAIGGVVLNARDVTDRVMAARELANRAYTDLLTGLPNRVRLLDRLESLLDTEAGATPPVLAMVCDIDQFKPLNTVVGRPAGTPCCGRWPIACGRRSGTRPRWPASAETPSWSSSPGPADITAPCGWPTASAWRWRHPSRSTAARSSSA